MCCGGQSPLLAVANDLTTSKQQHKRSLAQNGTKRLLSLFFSLSLSDTIVYNGSDKLNQIRCGMIVGMNAR